MDDLKDESLTKIARINITNFANINKNIYTSTRKQNKLQLTNRHR